MRVLISECDAELREYDAILTERTEAIQESMVLLFIQLGFVGQFGKSDASKSDARQRSRRSCKRRKRFQVQLDLHTVLGALYAFVLFWLPLNRSPMAAFFGASVRLLLLIAFQYMYFDN